ncbi:hypothetical protein AOA13_1635 [Listeria monocytogenes]|nr:hypothetical protein AOA13_1635 [Listeria monocytogenes]
MFFSNEEHNLMIVSLMADLLNCFWVYMKTEASRFFISTPLDFLI